jgi:hypothetical protein
VSGTPLYLSPEQAQAHNIGTWSDIYSLGCMFYELLTGAPPFSGAPVQLMSAHLFTPVPPLRDRRADVPVAVERLVHAMLAKEPEQRPTAVEVRDQLRGKQETLAEERVGGRLPRAQRAVSGEGEPLSLSPSPEPARGVLAVFGSAGDGGSDETLRLALIMNGVASVFVAADGVAPAHGDAALFLDPATPPERIQAVGLPAIATMSADDLPRFTLLMRAGVKEILTLPLSPSEVVRKVRSVWKQRMKNKKLEPTPSARTEDDLPRATRRPADDDEPHGGRP